MITSVPLRGGNVPGKKLEARIMGGVAQRGCLCGRSAHTQSVRQRRRQDHDADARSAARAMSPTRMGELSAERKALERAAVATGSISTLGALTDLQKRPPLARAALSREVAEAQPAD